MVLHKSCSLKFLTCGYSDTPEVLVKDYCFFNMLLGNVVDQLTIYAGLFLDSTVFIHLCL